MSERRYRAAGCDIMIKTGAEGPSYDPYSFTEYHVSHKKRGDLVLHHGLGSWLEINGERREFHRDPENADYMFEEFLGVSVHALEKACRRCDSRCRSCGSTEIQDVDGFPGETLYVCCKCGDVVGGSFDRSAIE